jgi:hypothetical protein
MPLRAKALALAFACTCLLLAHTAWGARRRVALVGGGGALERSVTIALSPWDLEVLPIDDVAVGSGMPAAAQQAKALATEHHVDAVAWISHEGQGNALWVYDAETDQTISRPIESAVATDDAGAAAIALTLKTMLRASTVAPPRERIGARAQPHGIGRFRLEVDATGRLLATEQESFDLRVGLAGVFWPRAWGDRVGVGLRLEEGTGILVSSDLFDGRLTDAAGAPFLRVRLPLASDLSFEPALATSLHLTTLDGEAKRVGTSAHVTRLDLSVDPSVLLVYDVGFGVEIGLRAGAAYRTRYQRYLVGGDAVLTLSPLQLDAGIVLGAALN